MVRAVFMIRRVWVGDSVANTSRHSRFVFGKPDEFKQMSPKISGYDRSHTVTSNENKISHRWRERAVIITDWSGLSPSIVEGLFFGCHTALKDFCEQMFAKLRRCN